MEQQNPENNRRIKIKCDCCGMETLAEIRGDKIVILDRRHGRKHIAVLSIREILDKMKPLAVPYP
ncbi:MAG: hypothetical protein HYX96_07680 [Chloroflexi bacterium]|nr:hypothetical protein [Chloroflexota bacterium]